MIFFCFAPFENNSLKWRPLPLMDCTFWPLYARHSWSLSREGSLACHTYCYTGHPFIWSSQRTLDTQSYCRAFSSGAVTTCFYDLGLSRLPFEHPNFRLRGELSNALLLFHRPGCMVWYCIVWHGGLINIDVTTCFNEYWIFITRYFTLHMRLKIKLILNMFIY